MGYVAVRGGAAAIEKSEKFSLVRSAGGASGLITTEQIREQLYFAVDRVMGEGSLYAPDLAALAFKQALTPTGILMPNTGHAGMGYVIQAAVRSLYARQQGKRFVARPNRVDLESLKDLIEAGKVDDAIRRGRSPSRPVPKIRTCARRSRTPSPSRVAA